MPLILKNKNLEIHLDLPHENYQFSRFDWTGKIVKVIFQHIEFAGIERTDTQNTHEFGKGFYNEFGIDRALGFEETEVGSWFHKIGVGLLKKDTVEYQFHKAYEIEPADFMLFSEQHKILISCESKKVNGYAYLLKKVIEIHESGFTIRYTLKNTGEKDIVTDEYNHNFVAINQDFIGTSYYLKFPFQLNPDKFGESVNPEQVVEIGQNEIKFNGTPEEQFFFSNLSGSKDIQASWELINLESKVGIRETGSFQTNKVNLWGWKHVVSPELFFKINLKPTHTVEWSRNYTLFKVE